MCSGFSTGAGSRAEASPALSNLCWDCEKGFPTRVAKSLHSTGTNSPRKSHGRLVRTDPSPLAPLVAKRVTRCTGRDEIRRRVVQAIPVEMVGKQGAMAGAGTGHPGEFVAAPVAGMCLWADLVVENQAGNRHDPGRRRQWMTGDSTHAFLDLGLADLARARGVIAGGTAKALSAVTVAAEAAAALFARVGDAGIITKGGLY